MLYLNTANTAIQWNGEVISNVRYPANIETLWSNSALAAIGLYKPVADNTPTPSGKQIGSYSVTVVNGVVTNTKNFIDIPAPVGTDVDAERDRRRLLPYTVTTSHASFPVNMDATSQANIQGLSTVGLYLLQANPTQNTVFRDYNNIEQTLSATDLVSMGLQVANHIQSLYIKSWAIKDNPPIPANYTDDTFWS